MPACLPLAFYYSGTNTPPDVPTDHQPLIPEPPDGGCHGEPLRGGTAIGGRRTKRGCSRGGGRRRERGSGGQSGGFQGGGGGEVGGLEFLDGGEEGINEKKILVEGRRPQEEGCRVEAGEFGDGQEQGMKEKGV